MLLINRETEQYIETDGNIEGFEVATAKEIIAYELSKLKTEKIGKLKAYLTSTDWYDIRSINGEACPEDITSNRALARTRINEIEACTSKTALNKIIINF